MLVYVADLFLDYLVRGPWRDPKGFNFPTTARVRSGRDRADPDRRRPAASRRRHRADRGRGRRPCCSARTIKGFEIRVVGAAPRAARFGGFNSNQLVLLTFAISGALAGLAGIIEVAGPDRASAAGHFAGLRLHRHHRRLPRAAEPDWNIDCRPFPRTHLHRRRAGPDRNENPAGRHQGVPGHPAVLRARLRFPHSLPLPADFRVAERWPDGNC